MPIHTNLTPERRKAMVELGAWNDRIITDYLDEAVTSAGHKAAIITYCMADGSRTELSYRELNERVTRIAAGLAGLGVGRGDIVSCQLPNWWQTTALHLACVRIGAVLNPLMPIFREHELSFMLGMAESKVLVVPQTFRKFDHGAMAHELQRSLPKLAHVLVIGSEERTASSGHCWSAPGKPRSTPPPCSTSAAQPGMTWCRSSIPPAPPGSPRG